MTMLSKKTHEPAGGLESGLPPCLPRDGLGLVQALSLHIPQVSTAPNS